jgi:hypothetical protein
LIFLPNLLVYSTLGIASTTNIIEMTVLFVAARFVWWAGFFLGTLIRIPFLRGPGFVLGMVVNGYLIYLNVSTLLFI